MCKLPNGEFLGCLIHSRFESIQEEEKKSCPEHILWTGKSDSSTYNFMRHCQAPRHAFLLILSTIMSSWSLHLAWCSQVGTSFVLNQRESSAAPLRQNLRLLRADTEPWENLALCRVRPMMLFLGSVKPQNFLPSRALVLWNSAVICNHKKQKTALKQHSPYGIPE